MSSTKVFSAKLPFYYGPLDLLFHLVRKQELDILEVSLTSILEQYHEYLTILAEFDLNNIGDFLLTASTLIEMKSFKALPSETETEIEVETPKQELVKQLLEYKKFSDAARMLQKRGEDWQLCFPRIADDIPQRPRNHSEGAIQEIEIWDLVSAFGRILEESKEKVNHEIIYDDTPITTHMKHIHQRLQTERRLAFRQLFLPGQHKTTLVGLFLASLELVRHEFVYVYQDINFGEIELAYRQNARSLDFSAL